MDRHRLHTDPFTGYFASVMLALVSSSWLASELVDMALNWLPLASPEGWKANLGAGLFIGISMADPVGTAIQRAPVGAALRRFGLGLGLGAALQAWFVMPVAGEGLSSMLMLIAALCLGPAMLLFAWVRGRLAARGLHLSDLLASALLRVLALPDRLLFILLMLASFAFFWTFMREVGLLVGGVGLVLAGITVSAIVQTIREQRRARNPELYRWLELEPEDPEEQTPRARLLRELGRLALGFLPGAVLFGAMTRIAVQVLLFYYPKADAGAVAPQELLRMVGTIAAGGLGLVFFGMIAALGFCLAMLNIFGRMRRWPRDRVRETAMRIVRSMYFRPMKRA